MDLILGVVILLMVWAMVGIAYDKGMKQGRLQQRVEFYNEKRSKYDASV